MVKSICDVSEYHFKHVTILYSRGSRRKAFEVRRTSVQDSGDFLATAERENFISTATEDTRTHELRESHKLL